MSEFKGTPGPWHVDSGGAYYSVRTGPGDYDPAICSFCESNFLDKNTSKNNELARLNACLASAAPELLEALLGIVSNAEQRVFEDWLAHETPGGDEEQVQSQFKESADYSEFCDEWNVALAVITKALGEA